MKISALASPADIVKPAPNPTPYQRALQAAAGKLPGANSQPVPNATSISPEEMGALSLKKPEDETVSDTNEPMLADATSEEAPAEPAKEDPMAAQHAIFARKERALRAEMNKFKAEQAKFKAEQEAARAPQAPSFDPSKYIDRERLKASPLDALIEAGLSEDELAEHLLSRNATSQTDPRLLSKLERMEAALAKAEERANAIEESQKQAQTASYQQALVQIKSEAKQLVYSGDTYEMIKATNSVQDVVDLIEETFKSEGRLMTTQEAADELEAYLEEEAMKLTKIAKLQKKMGMQPRANPLDSKQPQVPNGQSPSAKKPTLTNAVGTSRPMSARERAIAAMEGRNK